MGYVSAQMVSDLDKFFSEKTVVDSDRNTYLICNLRDKSRKITISLVFMRNWVGSESEYNITILEGAGAVLVFPPYWVSIPKELCMLYFTNIIENLYTDYFAKWFGDSSGNGSSNGSNGNAGINGCPCGCV